MRSSSRTARLLTAAALVLAGTTLSACSLAMPTDAVYTQAAGTNNRDSRVDVLNAVIVSTDNGSGTFVATLVNNETDTVEDGEVVDATDQLTGLEGVGDSAGLVAQVQPVEIPGGGMVVLADGEGIPISGAVIKRGDFIELELTFANAEPVTLEVPVVANAGAFEGQDGPAPEETEEPTEHAETE
jgi:copper(I)-binding protein